MKHVRRLASLTMLLPLLAFAFSTTGSVAAEEAGAGCRTCSQMCTQYGDGCYAPNCSGPLCCYCQIAAMCGA